MVNERLGVYVRLYFMFKKIIMWNKEEYNDNQCFRLQYVT